MKKYILFVLIGLLLGVNYVSADVVQPCVVISQNLSLGSRGEEVLQLQRFLNNFAGMRVATSGTGSPGFETSYFGPATKQAVINFQNKYNADILFPAGLTQGTGFVGYFTRAKIVEICGGTQPQTGIIYSVTTEKATYNQNEKIKISIKAENTTNEEKVLNFSDSCKLSYYIFGLKTPTAQTICTTMPWTVKIPPMGFQIWEREHDLANDYPVVPGLYKLTVKIIGALAETTFTVSDTTVPALFSVVSPRGGESWTLGTNHDIVWEFDPEVYFAVAPKFDLVVFRDQSCPPNTPSCIVPMYNFPYSIAKNVIGTGGISKYSWKVGEVPTSEGGTLPRGKYTVMICESPSGSEQCTTSVTVFTIK